MEHDDIDLDALVEQVTVDTYGDEGYWSFLQAFSDEVRFPFDASVIGAPVRVTGIDFDGDERRGLVAVVRRDTTAAVSLLDITIPDSEPDAQLLATAYRRWLGVT